MRPDVVVTTTLQPREGETVGNAEWKPGDDAYVVWSDEPEGTLRVTIDEVDGNTVEFTGRNSHGIDITTRGSAEKVFATQEQAQEEHKRFLDDFVTSLRKKTTYNLARLRRENEELADRFFAKAVRAIQAAFSDLQSDDDYDRTTRCIHDFMHGCELLLKAHIARHHPLLLATQKPRELVVTELWERKDFDDLHTLGAETLPFLLYYVDEGFDFLRDDHDVFEKARGHRNRAEHGSASAEVLRFEVLGPLYTRIIHPLLTAFEPDFSQNDVFGRDGIANLLAEASDPEAVFACLPAGEYLNQPVHCRGCREPFLFPFREADKSLTGTGHCLLCGTVRNVAAYACPRCQKRSALVRSEEFKCSDSKCRYRRHLVPVGCQHCGKFRIVKFEDDDFLCLSCGSLADVWKCDHCDEMFAGDFDRGRVPEAAPVENLCDACSDHFIYVYEISPHE